MGHPKVTIDRIVHFWYSCYWFWNEDFDERIGPFDNESEAYQALELYIQQWDPVEYVRKKKAIRNAT